MLRGRTRWLARAVGVAVGAAFVACSSFKSGTNGSIPEAGSDAPTDAGLDGADDAPPVEGVAACDPTDLFESVTVLSSLNSTANEFGATLTADELSIYFSSSRPGGAGAYDIYGATRPSVQDSFRAPIRLGEVSSAKTEDYPSISPDGLTLFFVRGDPGVGGTYDVFVARRGSVGVSFGAPTSLAAVNLATSDELTPFGAATGDLYFASDRRAAGTDIYLLPRLADGGFGEAGVVQELSSAHSELSPVLSFDGLTVYFRSGRTDQSGDPAGDIWVAHRPTQNAPFDVPTHLTGLVNSSATDLPSWLSPDNCRLYMTSERSSRFQLYVAQRAPR